MFWPSGALWAVSAFLSFNGEAAGVHPCSEEWFRPVDIASPASLETDAYFPCDARLRRYLSAKESDEDGLSVAWAMGHDQRHRVLTALQDVFAIVNVDGRAVLDTADVVISAALRAGVVTKEDGEGVQNLRGRGFTGAEFENDRTFRLREAAGAPITASLDSAVFSYRKSVIALANELEQRSARSDLMREHGVNPAVRFDFSPGPKVPQFARTDRGYEAALTYLTDPTIKYGDDAEPYEAAALSRLDYGLRNLLASRAAAIEVVVEASKSTATDLSSEALRGVTGTKGFLDLQRIINDPALFLK